MQKKIRLSIQLILCFFAIAARAQQDDNAFKDDYGNTYKNRVAPVIFPVIEERDSNDDDRETFDDDDVDPGSGEEDGGSVEGPEAPINGHLAYLAFAGIAFAGLYYRKNSTI